MGSIPSLNHKSEQLTQIEGTMSRLTEIPAACAFHPRCPLAATYCREATPELVTLDSGVQVACHQVATAPDEPTDSGLS